jgi:hypothetical protein
MLMLKRQKEGGRIHRQCLLCKSENTCGFYDNEQAKMVRLRNGNGHNGSNGSQKKPGADPDLRVIKPGSVEMIIEETMPEPNPTDEGGV